MRKCPDDGDGGVRELAVTVSLGQGNSDQTLESRYCAKVVMNV